MDREHILDLDLTGLTAYLTSIGEAGYRAKQLMEWIYERGATSFEQMSNLSKVLRQKLEARYAVQLSKTARRAVSSDGTIKLLLEWPDGATSECVMIPSEERKTACISSQVGCPVGCRFCASGLDGLQRNLTAGQIVEQVMRVREEAAAAGERLSNIVFMGLGEPLANYDNVMRAVRTINADWGWHSPFPRRSRFFRSRVRSRRSSSRRRPSRDPIRASRSRMCTSRSTVVWVSPSCGPMRC